MVSHVQGDTAQLKAPLVIQHEHRGALCVRKQKEQNGKLSDGGGGNICIGKGLDDAARRLPCHHITLG